MLPFFTLKVVHHGTLVCRVTKGQRSGEISPPLTNFLFQRIKDLSRVASSEFRPSLTVLEGSVRPLHCVSLSFLGIARAKIRLRGFLFKKYIFICSGPIQVI